MQQSFKARLAALEAARWARLSPLARAYELVDRGVPPVDWPNEELNAFCDERPELACLTDAELDEIIAAPPGQVEAVTRRLLEGKGYATV